VVRGPFGTLEKTNVDVARSKIHLYGTDIAHLFAFRRSIDVMGSFASLAACVEALHFFKVEFRGRSTVDAFD
jgi:hypothetical protein